LENDGARRARQGFVISSAIAIVRAIGRAIGSAIVRAIATAIDQTRSSLCPRKRGFPERK
jgi:hypothetical protein